MKASKITYFRDAVQDARNTETEIVRNCTARLRVPRNAAMRPVSGLAGNLQGRCSQN